MSITIMTKQNVVTEELLAQAESNNYMYIGYIYALPWMSLHEPHNDPWLTWPIQVQGGVTLGPEQGELEADSIALDIFPS